MRGQTPQHTSRISWADPFRDIFKDEWKKAKWLQEHSGEKQQQEEEKHC